jgi:hypothetical protein
MNKIYDSLITENRENYAKYCEVFAELDKIFLRRVTYIKEIRECDGQVSVVPHFTPTAEYNDLLKRLDGLQRKSRALQTRINTVLGYDTKTEAHWNSKCEREDRSRLNIENAKKKERKERDLLENALDHKIDV